MGVTIAYRGQLDDRASLPKLTADIQGACRELGWSCKDVETLVREGTDGCAGLSGVSLQTHPRCEWLHLHFDADGHLTNHFYWALLSDSDYAARVSAMLSENQRALRQLMGGERAERQKEHSGGTLVDVVEVDPSSLDLAQGVRYNWVKTQYAGSAAHVGVCGVLRHLKERYASGLIVDDDSGYFEHRNLANLERALAEVEVLVHRVTREVRSIPSGSVQTPRDLIERLKRALVRPKDDLH
ncbi:MAG TPA: hypothetical protein VI072_32170 [Polyangiaceae bacterium]